MPAAANSIDCRLATPGLHPNNVAVAMAEKISKTERQLNLISALLKSRFGLLWTDVMEIQGYDDDAAERSRQRRLERDLHDIAAIGLHIERINEDRTRVRYAIHRPSALLPSLHLDAEQRLLLYRIGLAYMEEKGVLGRYLSSALLKLQAGAGRDSFPVEPPPAVLKRSLSRNPAESAPLDEILKAWLQRRRIVFDYRSRDGGRSRRVVEPYALVSRRGGWYLLARDTEKRSVRTFRLSRLRGRVKPAGRAGKGPEYEIPADFDPEKAFSAQMFGGNGTPGAYRDVRIRFDADVAFAVQNEFEGIYRFTENEDGSAVLHLPAAWPGELLRYLGEFPGHWQIQHPPELRKLVVKQLKGALRGLTGGKA
jgi:proteasome accessory factor B